MNDDDEKRINGTNLRQQQTEPPVPHTKADLEVKKLHAEIDEISARSKNLTSSLTRWRSSLALAAAILSLFAGGLGLYYGYKDFSTRSKIESERRARQLDFNVGREVIDLSMSLSSSEAVKRRNAAILLSAYEEHSVPIHIANLNTHDDALAKSIIRSLKLIMGKKHIRNKPELVITPLIDEAKSFFSSELNKDNPDTLAMTFFATAFKDLFAKSNNNDVLNALQDLVALLNNAEKKTENENMKDKIQTLRAKVQETYRTVSGD
jgi:hypothetical protein